MDIWQDGVTRSPQRSYRDYPSFSSTLLDAIYRSMDEIDEVGSTNDYCAGRGPDSFAVRRSQRDASRRIRSVTPSEVTRSGCEQRSRKNPCTSIKPPVPRSGIEHWTAAISTSSDGSSYGGFSSSEAESVSTRIRPIRTSLKGSSTFHVQSNHNWPVNFPPLPRASPTVDGSSEKKTKKERRSSIRSRLLRELRNGRTSASPRGRLANFFSSLFSGKSKVSGNNVVGGEESACSSASSYSRSCLSKTPSLRGPPLSEKRTVKFCPISVIVDEDSRPCGHKFLYGVDRPQSSATASMIRVAEMLRRTEVEEEEEQEDVESDSSSDLFELENLAVIGPFQDELPVYETTRPASATGISHGFVL